MDTLENVLDKNNGNNGKERINDSEKERRRHKRTDRQTDTQTSLVVGRTKKSNNRCTKVTNSSSRDRVPKL